jgi:hypothetical protein
VNEQCQFVLALTPLQPRYATRQGAGRADLGAGFGQRHESDNIKHMFEAFYSTKPSFVIRL